MDKFFLHLLNKIEILTGIRQLERLQDKPEQLAELIAECSKAANQFPLKEEIVKSVLMDAVSSDQDFIGLNVKWVRKILNLYCQVHGVVKGAKEDEPVDICKEYKKLAEFWRSREDLDPSGNRMLCAMENIKRVKEGQPPVDDMEAITILAGMYAKQIEGTILAQPTESKRGGARIRENLDNAGIIRDKGKITEADYTPIPAEESALNEYCNEQAIKDNETQDQKVNL